MLGGSLICQTRSRTGMPYTFSEDVPAAQEKFTMNSIGVQTR